MLCPSTTIDITFMRCYRSGNAFTCYGRVKRLKLRQWSINKLCPFMNFKQEVPFVVEQHEVLASRSLLPKPRLEPRQVGCIRPILRRGIHPGYSHSSLNCMCPHCLNMFPPDHARKNGWTALYNPVLRSGWCEPQQSSCSEELVRSRFTRLSVPLPFPTSIICRFGETHWPIRRTPTIIWTGIVHRPLNLP